MFKKLQNCVGNIRPMFVPKGYCISKKEWEQTTVLFGLFQSYLCSVSRKLKTEAYFIYIIKDYRRLKFNRTYVNTKPSQKEKKNLK